MLSKEGMAAFRDPSRGLNLDVIMVADSIQGGCAAFTISHHRFHADPPSCQGASTP
jgi:hypothetical protein